MIYLARKANLAQLGVDSSLIRGTSGSCPELRSVDGGDGVLRFTISFDVNCMSDIDVALTCCDEAGFEVIVCDRSRRALKRGEVARNNPLLIFKSSVGIFL